MKQKNGIHTSSGNTLTVTVSSGWKLNVIIKSTLADKWPKENIKISIAEREDHTGTTLFEYTKIEAKGESPEKYVLTGKDDCTHYLFAKGEKEPWWTSMEDVKVDLKKGKTETKEIIIEPTFRNILFFSGSISYQEKHKDSKE